MLHASKKHMPIGTVFSGGLFAHTSSARHLHHFAAPYAVTCCAVLRQMPPCRAMVCCGVLCVLQGECHTRQHFHYMGQSGEVHADQAHRGYNTATDEAGYAALNPLYMR